MDEVSTVPGAQNKVEWKIDWSKLNAELIVAMLSLVIILLPAIIVKLSVFTKEKSLLQVQGGLMIPPAFSVATILVAFVFSIYALAKGKDHGTRVIALLAMIVTLVRLLLQ